MNQLTDTTRRALAASLDSLEIAEGGTVSKQHLDTLRAVSAALTAEVVTPLVVVPAAPETQPAPAEDVARPARRPSIKPSAA